MLRLAVPNKGTLSRPAVELLADAGYRVHREPKALFVTDADNALQLVFLRPMDIARTVGTGVLDAGITGQDLLIEAGTSAGTTELLELGFGGSALSFAAPPPVAAGGISGLDGQRVATSFPGIVERAMVEHGIKLELVPLDGAVETAVELGLADAIADVVETGASLRAAGLVTIGEPILRSEAVLVQGAHLSAASQKVLETLVARLRGVLTARQYVLMDYNCPETVLGRARVITPGKDAPTISRLDEPGWAAVRVMVRREESQAVMDRLVELGARAILVTPLEACRL